MLNSIDIFKNKFASTNVKTYKNCNMKQSCLLISYTGTCITIAVDS